MKILWKFLKNKIGAFFFWRNIRKNAGESMRWDIDFLVSEDSILTKVEFNPEHVIFIPFEESERFFTLAMQRHNAMRLKCPHLIKEKNCPDCDSGQFSGVVKNV